MALTLQDYTRRPSMEKRKPQITSNAFPWDTPHQPNAKPNDEGLSYKRVSCKRIVMKAPVGRYRHRHIKALLLWKV